MNEFRLALLRPYQNGWIVELRLDPPDPIAFGEAVIVTAQIEVTAAELPVPSEDQIASIESLARSKLFARLRQLVDSAE